MRLAVDCESDGLLDTITKIHCICATDLDTGVGHSFGPDRLNDALDLLSKARLLVFHNAEFDVPALENVLGWAPPPQTQVVCSLLLSRLVHSDLKNEDKASQRKAVKALGGEHKLEAWGIRLKCLKGDYGKTDGAWDRFSPEMLTYCLQDTVVTAALYKHLCAEGYSEEAYELEAKFQHFTEEMSRRGFTLDIKKTHKLYNNLKEYQDGIAAELQADIPGVSIETKTPAYYRVYWPWGGVTQDFPTKKAADAERKLRGVKPKDYRVEAGPNKVNYTPFNPGSRKQIRTLLLDKYGWRSPELTPGGFIAVLHQRSPLHKETIKTDADLKKFLKSNWNTPEPTADEIYQFAGDFGQINDETLSECDGEEAKKLSRYLMIGKRISQVGGAKGSWLQAVKPNGKIHHRNITIGCATFRNSHHSPNLAQIPKVDTGKDEVTKEKFIKFGEAGKWGYECRDCFIPSEGYDLVGADLAGIEACMLGHFLHPFDGGEFVDVLLNADIHQKNADAMSEVFGFEVLRNDTKSPFYATMYGGGLVKLGKTICRDNKNAKQRHVELVDELKRSLSEPEAIKEAYLCIGRQVKEGLERGIRGLADLQEAVRGVAKRGYLTPLDRRRIPVRSPHSALNSLLQGTAAIVMKRWIVSTFEEVKRRQWDCHLLAVIHDESQTECRPIHTEEYKALTLQKIVEAGEYYRLKCPLSGEAKVGKSWAVCH